MSRKQEFRVVRLPGSEHPDWRWLNDSYADGQRELGVRLGRTFVTVGWSRR